jgi:multidrug efflux pump subunit AcrB
VAEENGVYTVTHKDGKRVVYVTADVDEDKITALEVNKMIKKEFAQLPEKYLGYTVSYTGEIEKQAESKANLLISFAIALSFIFIILTAEFKSLIQPFIVMMAIPFGLIGVIYAFFLHGQPIGFFALMGIVGLTGVVVNDSIVLVDFINRGRQQGKGRRESIVEAGHIRLRPVLMTSITTVAGLVPVAYGIGGGDPFLKPLALAIVWGIAFSTVLTLINIPCLYALLDDFSEHILHRHMVPQKKD